MSDDVGSFSPEAGSFPVSVRPGEKPDVLPTRLGEELRKAQEHIAALERELDCRNTDIRALEARVAAVEAAAERRLAAFNLTRGLARAAGWPWRLVRQTATANLRRAARLLRRAVQAT